MMFVDRVLGSRLDPDLADRLHRLEHHGQVDLLTLPAEELARRRFKATSQAGEEVAVALSRDQKLFDGAVLHIDADRALVVRVDKEHWLRLEPRSLADAVELGYHAGNLHWRVRFQGEALLVALEAPVDHYLDRLGALVTGRRVAASVLTPD
jgi:urease accessory protein